MAPGGGGGGGASEAGAEAGARAGALRRAAALRRALREAVGAGVGAGALLARRRRRGGPSEKGGLARGRLQGESDSASLAVAYLIGWGGWAGVRFALWSFHTLRRRALRGALVDVARTLEAICDDADEQALNTPILLRDWWVDFGTLLGIVRDRRLIHWDNDVDIVALQPRWSELERELKRRLEPKGYHINMVRSQPGEFGDRNYEWLRISTKLHLLGPGTGIGAVPLAIVDLYGGHTGEEDGVAASCAEEKAPPEGAPSPSSAPSVGRKEGMGEIVRMYNPLLDVSSALALPTGHTVFHGARLRVPHNVEGLLLHRYGPSWRVPRQHDKGTDVHEESKLYFKLIKVVAKLGICI